MEKLIELLNKFEREMFPEEHEYIKFPDWTDDDWWCWYYEEDPTFWEQEWFNYTSRGDKRNSELNQLLIISKEFGFIKWLVENEKIDLDRIPAIEDNGATNIVLMLLSIQDEPIRFLCEILK
jgi:hypothetical protein